jgi:hypothetical protein
MNKQLTEGNTIQLHITLEDQFLYDIITNSIECSGLGYWLETRNYIDNINGAIPSAFIREDEEGAFEEEKGEWVKMDTEFIMKGLTAILTGKCELNDSIYKYILEGCKQNDAGDIDAECCDCIVQAALLGEITYG